MRLLRFNIFKQTKLSSVTSKKIHQPASEAARYLLIEDKTTGLSREIAYKRHEASQDIKVMFIPGFMSHMSGIKASALSEFCQEKKFTFTRYDPTGLGESRNIPLREARFSHWLEDAEKVLHLDSDPQIVVASSMGAWIALRLYLQFPRMISGMVLVAPGINFTKRYQEKITRLLPNSAVQLLEEGESLNFDHPEYGSFPISHDLLNDMLQYDLNLGQGLNVKCPVRIIHGMKDEDVPYTESMELLKSLKAEDVHLVYVKDGDHRLSRRENLSVIFDNLTQLTDL